jgi:hypothetical protein
LPNKLVKAPTTPSIAKAKAILFREAFRRIDRAIAKGFHLEAIAIVESLICDRIESTISLVTTKESYPDTLGPLLSQLRKLSVYPDELIHEIDSWRRDRNLVMHQMVKITNSDTTDWRSRMKFARLTALTGKSLLQNVNSNTNRVKRSYGGSK